MNDEQIDFRKTTMNYGQFRIRETVAKFFEPFRKHPLRMVIVSVIAGLVLFAIVDIGLAEVVRQNSYDAHMLASELMIELGPDYTHESRVQANMIRTYVGHLEQRRLGAILRLLYPKCGSGKKLRSALSALEQAKDDKEAEVAIQQAGLAVYEIYRASKSFPRSPILWFKSEVVPAKLLQELETAFDASTAMIDTLEKERTVDAAIRACRANREAILLLSLARLGFDNEERIRGFLKEVERSRDCTRQIADEEQDKAMQGWLYEVATSEERRVEILRAMLEDEGDMDEVHTLLRAAIERAFVNVD